jgi:type I restriction enzyme S subunit
VERYKLDLGDVVVAMDRPWITAGLKYSVVRKSDLPCLLVQRVTRLRSKAGLDQGYLGAIVGSKAFTDYVIGVQTGSAVPHISGGQIADFELPPLPSIEVQRAIAATLAAFDNKIESNRRLVAQTVNLAHALFESSLAGGKSTVKVGEVSDFHNRRRVPLSSREREQRPGTVPYYGATGVFGYVDEALFDEILVLVGEDGSVVRGDGGPVLQYVWGKAWINNHAHPLTGLGVSTELLFLALDRADVRPVVTGAVQPKISMANLKSVGLEFPVGRALDDLERVLAPLFGLYRRRVSESAQLKKVRDALLPELLGGRIRVPVGAA